jgi:FkbM family methyltransferase
LFGEHPLTSRQKGAAYKRFARWQIGSRILGNAAVMPFVDDTRLVVHTGMTGATGNCYVGLMEFAEMGFVLHYLREGDLFGDIGANVGVFTVLASGVRRARTVAVEPSPAAIEHLVDNVNLNRLAPLVQIRQMGVSSAKGSVRFTAAMDTKNHVATDGEAGAVIDVPVETLDDVFADEPPLLLKIDVEGFETEVLRGARRLLADPRLDALIVELNGAGRRYGFDEAAIHQDLLRHGFQCHGYDALRRSLTPLATFGTHNTLYLRNPEFALGRVADAPSFSVIGETI